MQKTIEQMLAIQRELQESQFKITEEQQRDRETYRQTIDQLGQTMNQFGRTVDQMLSVERELQERQMQMLDAVSRLIEVSDRHERRIEQLIGYSQ